MIEADNDAIVGLLDHTRALLDDWRYGDLVTQRCLAPDFSPFAFVRDDELGLSELLRWMLDATGTHGQADLFFRLLIIELELPIQPCGLPRARCEVATDLISWSSRRIDIHVRAGAAVLAIENKPDAAWQNEQLVDYLAQIRAETADGDFCLIALRGYGDAIPTSQFPPERISPAELATLERQRRFLDLHYSAIVPWIRRCALEAEAPTIKEFLDRFARYIEQRFLNTIESSLSNRLARTLLDDEPRRGTLFDVLAAEDVIFSDLGARFTNDLRIRAADAGMGASSDLHHKGLNTGISLALIDGHSLPIAFRIAFENKRYLDPYWGLFTPEGGANRVAFQRLKAEIEQTLGRGIGRGSERWLGWRRVERAQSGFVTAAAADLWRAMVNGSLVEEVLVEARAFRNILDRIGALDLDAQAFRARFG